MGVLFSTSGPRRPSSQPAGPSRAISETPGPRRLIALDFDCTIMRKHMWATYGDTAVEAIPSDREDAFVDLASFQGFVQ
eukprot:CAMPEP_0172911214 /NCGR_PEP_ID=MMETSP1075-20121228/186068_1 /TAXON_ID=2916 /ORGANISM="Ceratium fusus, Strain PA161109" /LENGTH=78 /DNA_ID=CAMNT_0013769483 /DNA_START=170 /DNA_END=403 /DNA_ORIENTATION=-